MTISYFPSKPAIPECENFALMASKTLIDVLERAKAWPEEDQEALAEYARELESERTGGIYMMTADERAAVAEGLAQAKRGEFATDDDMRALRKRFGTA